jgi:quinoprotein glucose dehydrogenase
VEERPVPRSDVPGEETWPTQPFPVLPPSLHPHTLGPGDAWGATPADLAFCREQLEHLRYDGMFTPPSVRGSVMYPGATGGINWGGMAVARDQGTVVTAINRLAWWAQLVPRSRVPSLGKSERAQLVKQRGTPYWLGHGPLIAPSRLPCQRPPWSTLVAVDLATGAVRWEVPLGTIPQLATRLPDSEGWGSVSLGGPIVTAGGLAFIAAGLDDHIRAFDIQTGKELWTSPLPAGGQATPMTYQLRRNGKQYVVICAGGHGALGTTLGDYVVAFALP